MVPDEQRVEVRMTKALKRHLVAEARRQHKSLRELIVLAAAKLYGFDEAKAVPLKGIPGPKPR